MTTPAQDDVIDILTNDHHDVLELIETIASSTDVEQRRDLADAVIAELVRHSVAEEMFVYPAMRTHLTDGNTQVQHDIVEHKQLEVTLKALEAVPADSTDFVRVLSELESQLRHHASEEEDTQFPQLRAAMSAEELVSIGAKVTAAKKIAPTRPHPASPNSALFHRVVGPGVGLVDRLRDALSGRQDNVG